MKQRIFFSMAIVSFSVCLIFLLILLSFFHEANEKEFSKSLKSEFNYIKTGYNELGFSYLNSIENKDVRITLISQDGDVIYDNYINLKKLDNHKSRPEIKDAIKAEKGISIRYSSTTFLKTFYYAEEMKDGNILRISNYVDTIWVTFIEMLPNFLIVFFLLIVVVIVISRYISRQIINPLENICFSDEKAPEKAYKEIRPFISRIINQRIQINNQMQEIRTQRDELQVILNHMTEGLIIVNNKNKDFLIMNPASRKILDNLGLLIKDSIGREHVKDDERLTILREEALKGKECIQTLSKNERYYDFLINPIIDDKQVIGAVCIIIDVTERTERENLRQEFSANVSHELKTPLTAISGYAEIISSGIAREKDISNFATRIHQEAHRLLHLIADIIHLSELDSSTEKNRIPTNVLKLTDEVVDSLEEAACKKNIAIKTNLIAGDLEKDIEVNVVPHLLEEIFYNLVDNAIKYNKQNGSINIEYGLKMPSGDFFWRVTDTGIGVSLPDQERIFERFYRVDKSRSREIGGTGLGLSIVKHATKIIGGNIEIYSTLNVGTTIELILPKELVLLK
ncbi:MAG: sensor histidine kinase [Succinivibrionaceae bacterium]